MYIDLKLVLVAGLATQSVIAAPVASRRLVCLPRLSITDVLIKQVIS